MPEQDKAQKKTLDELLTPLAQEIQKAYTVFLQQNMGNRVSEDMVNGLYQKHERIIAEWATKQNKEGLFNVNTTKK